MAAKRLDLTILQGETFQRVIRWEALPYVYKAITAITQAAPAVFTVTAHGFTTGWRAAPVSVKGMTEINTQNVPTRDSDMRQVTVVDPNTVNINSINSSDFSAYTSGGYLQSYTPVDLTGYDAVMEIKDRVGGTLLFTLSVANGRIVIDASQRTITLNVAYADVESSVITWTKGVYDLEMKAPTGAKTRIFQGNINVSREVTT